MMTGAERMRQWRLENPEKNAESTRLSNARRSGFYLSKEDYDSKVRMADGECVICGSDNNLRKLHTDHDHDTGKVRDLICWPCNQTIGLVKEDPDRLRAVADYLEYHA